MSLSSTAASPNRGPIINSSAEPHAIPISLVGKWGQEAKDCGHPADDGQGVMTIKADGFDLYEAHAQLAAVVSASDDRVRAAFAFAGERQNQTREVELALQSGGKSLIRREVEGDPPAIIRYIRCPRSSQERP